MTSASKALTLRLAPQLIALAVILMLNFIMFPQFFNIVVQNGRLYGSLIDVLNRGAPVALLAIGMTRLSMGPASIGPVKEMVMGLELEPVRRAVNEALGDGADGTSIRDLLTEWVDRQNLPV